MVGSAWSEYKKTKTIHGIPIEEELVESQKLSKPLFTPSTKADQGDHDENISPEQGSKFISVYPTFSTCADARFIFPAHSC